MKAYDKPLPQPTPWSASFWEGCKNQELLIQQCRDCRKYVFYPKLFCPHCLSENLECVKSKGRGKVYSYSIIQSYAPSEFAEDLPYVVAVIELEEGVRMMSNIVDCPLEEIQCDMPVEVVFEQVTEEFTLPRFKPAS